MTGVSPSIAALRGQFGTVITRHLVSCGDTVVYAERAQVHDVLAWLKQAPGQEFNYRTDVTAVALPFRPAADAPTTRWLGLTLSRR